MPSKEEPKSEPSQVDSTPGTPEGEDEVEVMSSPQMGTSSSVPAASHGTGLANTADLSSQNAETDDSADSAPVPTSTTTRMSHHSRPAAEANSGTHSYSESLHSVYDETPFSLDMLHPQLISDARSRLELFFG